ncbi:MAG TPA: tRNA 2-thiouridine(34) synthase MnmA [Polyangiaceae bacterium]|jgi:tRNA-specific 2-thiouridylase|nr:tRNA 2-thiouridine(34) synthase MnmA [Polyangiaceae bacterium]
MTPDRSTDGSPRERVIVAMSGGVDSSVAAARLHDAGYDVVGVTLHLWDYPDDGAGSHERCCAPEDQYDARRVADAIGFPHYTFDRRELFAETVVRPFVDAYVAGETPSPCTACNRSVKLAELFAIADRLGARRVATGHYARIVRDGETPRLARGADRTKDQSYFLYASPRAWLERLLFPLGDASKREVRDEAVARRLPGATKGESQELCFVGSGAHAYADFVAARADGRVRAGPIVDGEGRTVGGHEGVHRFTIGQRRGLGVALGKPAFVTDIDVETATVRLGGEAALFAHGAALGDVVLAEGVTLPLRATVRVRYRHEGDAARVEADPGDPGGARLAFESPVRAITRGQIAVFYEGDRVLGGGRIAAVSRSTS